MNNINGYGSGYGGYGYVNNAYQNQVYANTVNQGYVTNKQKKNNLVCMIIGIICGSLMILCPFMNYATLHFDISLGNLFNLVMNQSIESFIGNSEDDTDSNKSDQSLQVDSAYGIEQYKITYGCDMFELCQMGKNYVSFGKVSQDELQDLKDSSKEVEDFVRYEIDLEGIGITIDDHVFDELFGLISTSIYAHNALVIVPYVLIASGILIILFSILKKPLIMFIFQLIAMGSTGWLIASSDRFTDIMGIGIMILIIVLIVGFINAICGMVMKKK